MSRASDVKVALAIAAEKLREKTASGHEISLAAFRSASSAPTGKNGQESCVSRGGGRRQRSSLAF